MSSKYDHIIMVLDHQRSNLDGCNINFNGICMVNDPALQVKYPSEN